MVTLMTAAPSTLPPLGDSEAGGATATAMQSGVRSGGAGGGGDDREEWVLPLLRIYSSRLLG